MILFIVSFYTPSKLSILFFLKVFTPFILILSCNGGVTFAAQNENISIGAIVDVNTRVGKEVLIAMKLATQYNNNSIHLNISFNFYDSCGSPLQAAYAAAELIKNDVQAIIAPNKWEEAALVADVANTAQVPTISFAPNAAKTSFVPSQWPFLIQMASDINEQIRCIAAIVRSFSWQKVIPIYEADMYGGDSGVFAALSDAVQAFGVDIEYRLVIPPFHSLPDPKEVVQAEVAKLVSKQSRVFIVLHTSLSFATHLFTEAKQMGLVGKDSVWILTEGITTLLDSVDTSVVSSMEGALGIKSHISEDSRPVMKFRHNFRKMFRAEYPEEDNSDIGIYAVRAHDSITVLANGIRKLGNRKNTSKDLVQCILTTNFTGLSGNIAFNSAELSQSSTFRIVNFVGKKYRELGFWSSTFGFSDIHSEESVDKNRGSSMKVLADSVFWPGHLKRVPKGWSMPTVTKPMKFGVPGATSFEKFVKVDWGASSKENNYSGFCIDVFHEVLQLLEQNYPLPYEFIPYNGTYDDLVDLVANKSFDAIIGDVTILANRSKIVEFTQPFAESGLTMIVPEKSLTEKAWIFLKPFSIEMWGLTAAILLYNVLIVWLLERHSSPEFEGPWQNQLSTALWFTSSSLFFAQREQIHSNYARVAVSVWLFVVLALTSCYTASLSSMLTAPRLEQNVTDIGWLKNNNATVGCDGSSFVRKYLEDVLGFAPVNIKNISKEFNYAREFENGSITAAFLEVPYKKAFLNHHCKGYRVAGPSDGYGGNRFGGLGFVFPKGSPIANDVSQGILTLLENGRLKQLENKWFAPSSECRTTPTLEKTESLSWHSLSGLYLLSACTSSLCYLVHVSRRLYERHHEAYNNVYSSLVSFSERLYASGLETLILLHGFSD